MGIFDDVRCEMDLPDCGEACPHVSFQTKTFPDPYMDKYVIKRDGTITRNGDPFEYHGILNFYTSRKGGGQDWWEWDAKFIDGVCVSITPILDKP